MSKQSLDINDLITENEDLQIITNGEAAILAKLSELEDKIDEVIEKLTNLSLSDDDGLHLDAW